MYFAYDIFVAVCINLLIITALNGTSWYKGSKYQLKFEQYKSYYTRLFLESWHISNIIAMGIIKLCQGLKFEILEDLIIFTS